MKKINLLLLLVITISFVSCDFDEGFEDLNVDPTASSYLEIKPKFSYLFLKSAGEEYEVSYTEILCAGQLVQQVIDPAFPQSSIYSIREDLNHAWWDTQYTTTIKTVVDIIDQLATQGNTGSEMGIARIWKVFLFHKIVDTYGETPYFDAGMGYIDSNFRPKYDKVDLIYADMLKELEEGVAQIGSSTSLGDADLIYQGDTTKWKKFGNSLMLRLAMRIKNVDPAGSNAWAAKAITGGVMESLDDSAYVTHTDGPSDLNRNAWGTYAPRYPDARIGATLYDWLASESDPRLSVLSDPNGPDAGAPYGLKKADINGGDLSGFAVVNPAITKKDSPRLLFTYAQSELMLAEYYTGSDATKAEDHFNNGVTAAMQQWAWFGITIPAADITTYLSSHAYNAATALEDIGEQFWVASFFDFFESFANWRRTGYPALQPFGGNTAHPENTTNGTIPRRLIVNPNEANVNTDNFNAMITSQGPNNLSTKVWWDN
jgi:hypothetical protein